MLVIGVASIVFATSCKRTGYCKKGKDSVVTETRDLSTFTGVNSEGSFDVYITQDNSIDAGFVKISAPSDLMEYIETSVQNGVLTIENERCFRGDNRIEIYVTSKEINDISLAGSGNITTTNELVTENMNIILSGSGNIESDLQVNSLNTEIIGSGNIKTFGETVTQKLIIEGSGNIENFGITSSTATAKITGSGNIEVYASKSLDVKIDGSGNVTYKGDASVTSSVEGSGTINNGN